MSSFNHYPGAKRRQYTDAQIDGFFDRLEASQAASREEAARIEAAEKARLAGQPEVLTSGDWTFRREGAEVFNSYRGGEFTHVYSLRIGEEFNQALADYLASA